MRKVLTVAKREYRAAVHTKTFVLSLMLMPLVMALSVFVQMVTHKAENQTTKTNAIVDRTGQLREAIEAAREKHDRESTDAVTGERTAPLYRLIWIDRSPDTPQAIKEQRFALSERLARGEFEGFVEIGPEVFDVVDHGANVDDRHAIRLQSSHTAAFEFATWARSAVNEAIREQRFEKQGIPPGVTRRVQSSVPLRLKALTKRDPASGELVDAPDANVAAAIGLPLALVIAILMTVLAGVVPAMQGIVEEKQQRIAEVLLGCVSPFRLMLGKLLGVVGVSLTVTGVYLLGGFVLASRFDVAALLTPGLIAWFVLFLVLATVTYGSLFIGIGAASADLKDSQSLQTPIVMLVTLPVLLLSEILRNPSSQLSVIGSLLPFSSSMLMPARLAGPGVPLWQPATAALLSLVTALGCLWMAGRVFRIGFLSQGKGITAGEIARWIFS